jgi:hypothetical protein
MEELRGGNLPEEGDGEHEERDEKWRLPREYFTDEGLVSKETRVELLVGAGHRRTSVDWNAWQAAWLKDSRKKHSRSKIGLLLVQGANVDDVFVLDKQFDATRLIGEWLLRKAISRGARITLKKYISNCAKSLAFAVLCVCVRFLAVCYFARICFVCMCVWVACAAAYVVLLGLRCFKIPFFLSVFSMKARSSTGLLPADQSIATQQTIPARNPKSGIAIAHLDRHLD